MVRQTFSAAHFLPNYNGKCKNLHGHNWTVEVFFNVQHLKDGLAIDFKEIKEKLNDILKELDHTNLNDRIPFKKFPPTCENVALHIYYILSEEKWKNSINPYLYSVRVWESENTYAEYIKDKVK
jgi:6-pyruvoyltetrahydropterin/6-carboxytetrahydropterin synthase